MFHRAPGVKVQCCWPWEIGIEQHVLIYLNHKSRKQLRANRGTDSMTTHVQILDLATARPAPKEEKQSKWRQRGAAGREVMWTGHGSLCLFCFHAEVGREGPRTCSRPCLSDSAPALCVSDSSSYLCLPPPLSQHISIVLMLTSHYTMPDCVYTHAHTLRQRGDQGIEKENPLDCRGWVKQNKMQIHKNENNSYCIKCSKIKIWTFLLRTQLSLA